jgi:hypothetical protein
MNRNAVTWSYLCQTLRATITIALLASAPSFARAQPATTVTLYISFGPGGGYDFYGRADIAKAHADFDPLPGDKLQQLISSAGDLPPR